MSPYVVVRGGAGGTVATLEHLRHGARLLRAAADQLEDAGGSAVRAERGLGPPGPALTLADAHAALAPLVGGPGSFGAHAVEARGLAAALARAADAFDQAEGAAGDAVRQVLAITGHHAGDRPVAAVLASALAVRLALPGIVLSGAVLQASGRGPAVARRLATTDPAEVAVQALAGFVRGLGPGTALPDAVPAVGASRLVTATSGVAALAVPRLGRRPLEVTARLGADPAGSPPRSAADVLERVGRLYPRSGGAAGTVGVDRLDHPDGSRTWVVAIPGTQDATSFGASTNPMDMATNIRLMATAADDSSELVTRALDQAGALPGEAVLLAGHSQGGLAAMALAGSAAFTARHRVAAVLTAGSPVATHRAPRGTAVLHLEHRQDLVPALDGWANPDRPHRTTAVRDLALSPLPVDRLAARSPGAAHEVSTYTRTARAVSAAGGPSVRGWERALTSVLGGPGVTVVRHEFTGARAPVPARASVLAPGPGPSMVSARGSRR